MAFERRRTVTTATGKKRTKPAVRGKTSSADKGNRKPQPAKKPLRIREELLPGSSRYITIDGIEYVALPVADFRDWYEDIEDRIALEEARADREPGTPIETVMADLGIPPKAQP